MDEWNEGTLFLSNRVCTNKELSYTMNSIHDSIYHMTN